MERIAEMCCCVRYLYRFASAKLFFCEIHQLMSLVPVSSFRIFDMGLVVIDKLQIFY